MRNFVVSVICLYGYNYITTLFGFYIGFYIGSRKQIMVLTVLTFVPASKRCFYPPSGVQMISFFTIIYLGTGKRPGPFVT